MDLFETTYLSYSRGGKRHATKFEENIAKLFREQLKYNSFQTGQMNRPNAKGGYSDVFVADLNNNNCAIIDCKAISDYNISTSDYRAMTKSYMPSYRELAKKLLGKENVKLAYVTYVAGGLNSGIERNLQQIKDETGVDISAIDSINLLDICRKAGQIQTAEKITGTFQNTKIIQSRDFHP